MLKRHERCNRADQGTTMATTGIAHYVTPSMTIFDLPTAVSVAIKIESESRSQTIHAEG